LIGRTAILASAALLLAGCAATHGPFDSHLASEAQPVRACAEWFQALEAEIDAGGVRDAQDARVRGFPYLRVDRALAALAPKAAQDWNALHALADRMTGLDLAARRAEIANLPEERVRALPGLVLDAQRGEAASRTRECARLLREIDFSKPASSRLVLARATVPDDYSSASRFFGIYALSRIPFAAGVRRWEAETLASFERRRLGQVAPGQVRIRIAPPASPVLGHSGVAGILAGAARNPLGIPEPTAQDRELLLAAHAPSFEIDVAGDADRFGRLHWVAGAPSPAVDATFPTVYARISHAVYRGRVLLQLVYTIWFPERPPQANGDIYAGRLDGVTWRVTLAEDGEPVLFDSIHPCGCYHLFFPTPRARTIPSPGGLQEWAFSPTALPRVQPGERALLRIASGTHYLEGVEMVRGLDSLARYTLASDEDLRSLPLPGGGRRSIFGPDGLVPGTEREERDLFWPMGIASAGAMRQWGRHATAFVGRRHFDDADLVERRFILEPP